MQDSNFHTRFTMVSRNTVWFFGLLMSWLTVCKGSVFLQFWDKIQSSIHQIFTQMYSTVSIGPSYKESPTGFSEALFLLLALHFFFIRHACRHKFFKAGEVSWNLGNLIKISSKHFFPPKPGYFFSVFKKEQGRSTHPP